MSWDFPRVVVEAILWAPKPVESGAEDYFAFLFTVVLKRYSPKEAVYAKKILLGCCVYIKHTVRMSVYINSARFTSVKVVFVKNKVFDEDTIIKQK